MNHEQAQKMISTGISIVLNTLQSVGESEISGKLLHNGKVYIINIKEVRPDAKSKSTPHL